MDKSKIFRHVPMAIALCGVIMLIAAFFLPYASANSEYGEWLSNNADSMYAEEIGMTNGEAGLANYFYFIGIAITLVGAIWLIITKNKIKKTVAAAEGGDLK